MNPYQTLVTQADTFFMTIGLLTIASQMAIHQAVKNNALPPFVYMAVLTFFGSLL